MLVEALSVFCGLGRGILGRARTATQWNVRTPPSDSATKRETERHTERNTERERENERDAVVWVGLFLALKLGSSSVLGPAAGEVTGRWPPGEIAYKSRDSQCPPRYCGAHLQGIMIPCKWTPPVPGGWQVPSRSLLKPPLLSAPVLYVLLPGSSFWTCT